MNPDFELHIYHMEDCGLCTEQLRILKRWSVFVTIRTVDVNKHSDISDKAGVDATPTLILLHKGFEIRRWIGLTPPAQIQAAVADHILRV